MQKWKMEKLTKLGNLGITKRDISIDRINFDFVKKT